MSKRKGRKANYITFGSTEITGLSLDKATLTYYTYYSDEETNKRKKKYFGRDLVNAIEKFDRFQNQQTNRDVIHESESITNLIKNNVRKDIVKRAIKNYLSRIFHYNKQIAIKAFEDYIPDEYIEFGGRRILEYILEEYPNKLEELYDVLQNYAKDKRVDLDVFDKASLPDVHYVMPEDVFWARVRKEILSNPVKVSQQTGIEEISYLRKLVKPVDYSLNEVLELYINRVIRPLTPKAKRDSGNWFNEFSQIINRKDVSEIQQEDISKYEEEIYNKANTNQYSSTWIKHRFNCIKTVLNYSLRKLNDKTDIQRVLLFFKSVEYPQKTALNPTLVSKKDYHKLLEIADDRWRAILLLALNAAMYPKDISDIKKSDIDLSKKCLIMIRQKTGVRRVATIWDRTATALNKYFKKHPNNSEYVFISNFKGQYKAQSIRDYLRVLRTKADVSSDMKFEHLRDTAQSVAANAGCNLDDIRFLLGHKVAGVTDNYLVRDSDRTKKVCRAIEKYFFR